MELPAENIQYHPQGGVTITFNDNLTLSQVPFQTLTVHYGKNGEVVQVTAKDVRFLDLQELERVAPISEKGLGTVKTLKTL